MLPPVPAHERVSECAETFSPSQLTPQGADLHPNSCISFFLIFLPYLILCKLACLFGSLGSYVSIQKVLCRSCSTCRYIFDVFVGERDLHILLIYHLQSPPLSLSFYIFIFFRKSAFVFIDIPSPFISILFLSDLYYIPHFVNIGFCSFFLILLCVC